MNVLSALICPGNKPGRFNIMRNCIFYEDDDLINFRGISAKHCARL